MGRQLGLKASAWIALSLSIAMQVVPARAASYDDTTAPPEQTSAPETPPATPAAVMRQATALMVQGQYGDAEAAFKSVLAGQPDNVEALAGLGMALGRQYKLTEADEQFEKVLAIQPNHPVAHCGKAMVLLYRIERNDLGSMTKLQALKLAGRECNKALDADPRVVEAHYLLGTVFKEEGRTDLAIQAFSGAIRLDPHYVRAYNLLASVQMQKGSLSEAIENYKQAMSIQPKSVNAHLGLAEVYGKEGRWSDAMQELRTVISISPKNVAGHMALAQALETRGEVEAALHEYEELKAIKPDDAQSFIAIAKLSEKQGDFNRALIEAQQALKMVPQNAQMRMLAADNLLRLGKTGDALREYQLVASAEPSSSAAIMGELICFYSEGLRTAPLTVAATAQFQAAAQKIGQTYKTQPANQTLQLADAIIHVLAGQNTTLPANLQPAGLSNQLLYAELLLCQHKFADAGLAFAGATNGSTNPDEVAVSGDTAYALRELDSAEAAYKRLTIFTGRDQRGQLGLAAVAAARNEASANLNAASTLFATRQYKPALERYRIAVGANPALTAARLGLAETLEKDAPAAESPLVTLREAVFQYKSYLALSPGMMLRDQDKIQKRIARLESTIAHIQQNPSGISGIRGLLERLSVR